MTSELALMSAQEMLQHYREGTLSPVETTRAALDAIDRHNERLNAFVLVDPEGALNAARESEKRWRLGVPRGWVDGVPTSIKDIILTKDWPTLRGSRTISAEQPWDEDAPCTARLREHGAVFLGKTTTPEFGWKGVTDSAHFGITRNPWNSDKTTGGSSGGAAAALASGMGALAIGTDGGGSIRIPAGFTGVFGIKATFGRVPAYPMSPFGTVAHVGPMTRTVGDAAVMLSVIAEPDPRDWYALPDDGADYSSDLESGVEGLKIAFAPTFGGFSVEPEIAELVQKAIAVFEDLGATVEQAEPNLAGAEDIFRRHWYAGAANLLSRFTDADRAQMDPGLQEIAQEGAGYTLPQYLNAVADREALGQAMNRFHAEFDLLVTPGLPIAAFDAGMECPAGSDFERWFNWTPFTYPFNLTQQPAASVPCGLTGAGLPAAIQIVGPSYSDALVLRAARAYEMRHPFALPSLD